MAPTEKPAREVSRKSPPRRQLVVAAVIGATVLALVFLAGYIPRRIRMSAVAAAATKAVRAVPTVNVVKAKRAPAISELLLPGMLTPLTEAYIYARATGYVRKRFVDIGDHVKAGQVLAQIEAPDLDDQVGQAQAALAQSERNLDNAQGALHQAQAQLELARVTWNRYKGLADQGVISRQEADQALAAFNAGTATVQALEANVAATRESIRGSRASLQRLQALQDFERVRAPFSGIVTARNIDIGAFISGAGSALGQTSTPMGGTQNSGALGTAGTASASSGEALSAAGSPGGSSASGTGGEMFRIAQSEVLRVLVDVPEESAPLVHPGQSAELLLQAFPGRTFTGRLTRTANALNANTHTLLTEVQMRNAGGELLPGMYAQVKLASKRQIPPVLVPGSSLIIRADGPKIAVLEDPKRPAGEEGLKQVHLQPVTIGRDYGTETEITTGLEGWEYIVATPGDSVQEGALVKPASIPGAEAGARPQGGAPSQVAPGGITPGGQGRPNR